MHQIQTEIDKNTKKFRFLKILCSFCVLSEKLCGLEKKDIQQGTNSLSERLLLRSRPSFLLKKTHNLRPKTKTSKFFTFLRNFCQISQDFVDQNVEYDQQRMISLTNSVVCGDKCSFVKKCNKDHEIVNKSYFFLQFCIFQRNFCKNFNLFMDQNSETVQQQLKAFSCRLFDGICASF